jgi:hypothetical protein
MSEFEDQLSRHLRFISKSCIEFDNGQQDEALRIAVSIRVLFHDTKNSTSLVTYLKAKDSIKLISTFCIAESLAFAGAENIDWHTVLPLMLTSNGVQAPLNSWETQAIRSVEDWWNEMIWKESGNNYTRRDVVLSAANQDGGAHVDAKPNHKTLKFREGPKVTIKIDGIEIPNAVSNHHYALLRQMAYELLNSEDLLNICNNT